MSSGVPLPSLEQPHPMGEQMLDKHKKEMELLQEGREWGSEKQFTTLEARLKRKHKEELNMRQTQLLRNVKGKR